MQNTDDEEVLYYLSLLSGIGSKSALKLIKSFRPLSGVLYADDEALMLAGIERETQRKLISGLRFRLPLLHEEYLKLKGGNIRFISFLSDEYPERLRNIPDPPMWLYIKGEYPGVNQPAVSIVGSRSASIYGKEMAEYIAYRLAEAGVFIVSGMASGIDGAAHRGAIKAFDKYKRGGTAAVLGCGADICYPRGNIDIYNNACIISEFPPGMQPLRENFPLRNRIISGLADIVAVIEARDKSGSLITADFAMEQGREVYALPGRITDELSRGCNKLISQGAGILCSPDDIIEALGIIRERKLSLPSKNINLLAKNEKRVYSCLDLEPKFLDDIVKESGLSYQEAVYALLKLELDGHISRISGNYYGISYSNL